MKNVDGTIYKNAIISFLEGKYEKEFSVLKLYQEFDGNSGMMVRALCSEKEGNDQFAVYCYFDSKIAAEKVVIDNIEHSIVDTYAEVSFQKVLRDEVVDIEYKDNCIVECNIDFNAKQPSKSDVDAGLAFCLQKKDLDPYIKFYVIVDYNTPTENMQKTIEGIMSKYRPCTGYIYIAYVDQFNITEISNIYAEKQNDFGNYLTNTDFADRVEFVLFKSDTGLQDKQIIRE